MGLFDFLKKKSACASDKEKDVKSDIKNEEQPNQSEDTLPKRITSEGKSVVSVLEIYQHYSTKANTDKIYGEPIIDLGIAITKLLKNHSSINEVRLAYQNLYEEVIRTVYIVPFYYNSENEYPNDRAIHYTPRAANKLSMDSIIYRCRDMTTEQIKKLYWVIDDSTHFLTADLNWWDITRIAGSEGFHFEEEHSSCNMMYPFTFNDGGSSFFIGYTDISHFLSASGEKNNMHIALFTIDDIVDCLFSSNEMQGLVINYKSPAECFMPKSYFKNSVTE